MIQIFLFTKIQVFEGENINLGYFYQVNAYDKGTGILIKDILVGTKHKRQKSETKELPKTGLAIKKAEKSETKDGQFLIFSVLGLYWISFLNYMSGSNFLAYQKKKDLNKDNVWSI